MASVSRRKMLAAGAAGSVAVAAGGARAASFGNPDEPPQGAINARTDPSGLTMPGPRNPALDRMFPGALSPPPTDAGDMPLFWASFNTAPKRIQDGGWARQVTQADFQISTTIAGVDMRLARGAIRELHWHLAAEWAFVSYGSCRVTTIDAAGRANVEDVHEGGLWYFPAGMPHSLQGIGDDGCQFILCFDDGHQTEYGTFLLTDWMAHTPPDVLALNFGVPADTFKNIPLHQLYIFPGKMPGSLEADQAAASGSVGKPEYSSVYALGSQPPARRTAGGFVQIADSRNFPVSKTIAAALVTVHPGGMREMHWHPNADEWQYYIQGTAEMTVFRPGPDAVTQNFNPGDIGYVPQAYGHYVRNTGKTDLKFLEVFRSSYFADVSLSDWLTHTPPQMVAQHLRVDPATIGRFPNNKPEMVPE